MKASDVQPLALSAVEAARAIGVCPRTLATMTKRGEVPHVRIGRRVLYRPEALQAWLAGREIPVVENT